MPLRNLIVFEPVRAVSMKIKPIADENGSYLAKAEEIPTWSLCILTGFFDFLILPYSSLDSTSEQKKRLTAVSGIADDE